MGENYKEEIRNHTTFREGDKVNIVYQFNCREYNLLKEKYSISETDGMTDLEKAFYLLKWVNKYILHTGCYDNSDKQDTLKIITAAYASCGGRNDDREIPIIGV